MKPNLVTEQELKAAFWESAAMTLCDSKLHRLKQLAKESTNQARMVVNLEYRRWLQDQVALGLLEQENGKYYLTDPNW